MHESIAFLVRVQCRRKESSRSLSHLLMSFLFLLWSDSPGFQERFHQVPMRTAAFAAAHDVSRCRSFFQDNPEPIAVIRGAHQASKWEMDTANSLHSRKILANVGGQQIQVVTYTTCTIADISLLPRIHVQAVVGPLRSFDRRKESQSSHVRLEDPTTVVDGVIPSTSDLTGVAIR